MPKKWNYRVFHREKTDPGFEPEHEWSVREAYYDDNGNVSGWSEFVYAKGETLQELVDDVAAMADVVARYPEVPVLEIDSSGSTLR